MTKLLKIFCFGRGGGCEKYARKLSKNFGIDISFFPIEEQVVSGGFVMFVFPVYGGSLPRMARESLKMISANNSTALIISVCGGISHGNALFEAASILTAGGFTIAGAGKFIAEHSYNHLLSLGSADRPNNSDLSELNGLAMRTYEFSGSVLPERLRSNEKLNTKKIGACVKYPVVIEEKCQKCMSCVKICPFSAIDNELKIDVSKCQKCLKCAASCKSNARINKFSRPFVLSYLKKRPLLKKNELFF